MLNTPWEAGSPLYRKIVIAALILSGVGVLLVVLGAFTGSQALMYTALPFIVLGMAAHLGGLAVRARDARRRVGALTKDAPKKGRP
ncbi:hypothetical protein BN1051_02295 [Arthrobacter saudimassiliensis]|uniref:DUF3188 domain-containing protein n=1 Tax=Arthrobacter saudimassiliensis TaxID=1461584 RepID=A0A078MRN8_9MICC|nr:hypothetical protein BN1051_02295 [Arthrobacter saudimassiliensis]